MPDRNDWQNLERIRAEAADAFRQMRKDLER